MTKAEIQALGEDIKGALSDEVATMPPAKREAIYASINLLINLACDLCRIADALETKHD